VAAPTGTFTLMANGAALLTMPASAQEYYIAHTSGYPAGTYDLTLEYSGDAYNGPSTSAPFAVTLNAP
jgi:hypothetical protein